MTGLCRRCDRLLFPYKGDGDYLCADCLEKLQEELPPAIEPEPGKEWHPVHGRIGGTVL